MADVDIADLSKEFGSGADTITAVDDFDVDIEDGTFLVLVGPSGCGKSTTLRMVAGLESPTDGDIRIGGESVVDEAPRDRDIAMVFQNYALYPHKTARGNMSFGLRMATDMSDDEVEQRVDETAEMMGIGDLLDKKPKELSGGQQQRVALGRAIVRDPEVFLMDEPLSNLDAKLRSQMRTELQSLQQELDVTTIYVTHDQTEAMTMADRIAIMNEGELQQVATPLECYYQPVNEFVAGFIGSPSMNFVDVTRDDNRLVHDVFTYELSRDLVDQLPVSTDYRLGVRPEDLYEADPGEPNVVEATIDVVEPMGDQTHLYVEVGDDRLTVTMDGKQTFDAGSTISLTFPEEELHLFDATTGANLTRARPGEEGQELTDVAP